MKKDSFIFIGIIILLIAIIIILVITPQKKITSENESFTKILEKGIIIVGTGGEYPPFSYYENNELTGFDIELIKEIMERMDIEIEFIIIPWTELFSEIQTKKVDMIIGGITITSERSEEMLFSNSYFTTGQSIVVQKENTEINSTEDLHNKKVGTQIGTTSADIAIKYASSIKFIAYENTLTAIEDLKQGIIEATIVDNEVANKIIRDNDDLKIIGDLLSEEDYGIITQKENIALMEEINKILQEIKDDGTLDKLEKKWFE